MQQPLRLRWIALIGVALILGTGVTRLHLHLTKSFPAEDQVFAEAPDSIRLWFSEPVELPLSAIRLEGPEGNVDVGDLMALEDGQSLKVHVNSRLLPGSYHVNWRAVGDDGHPVRGRYTFAVSADVGVRSYKFGR